ncbi:AroM family protein [Stenotrophomonas mori]|uniref:AroM family protein n=1 Tax=Stenotrophomonas mori TaxID=2871096 RepID=A0ABT0SI06_9GAMM|nr:AroM family protein [Stenotrophomonas mori]
MISSLALVTIGQTPRPDMVAPIGQALAGKGRSLRLQECGLLDGLDAAEVAARYAPGAGGIPLVTKLRDGRVVAICSEKVETGLQALIDRLESDGIEAILLLCTGRFDRLRTRRALLVQPDVLFPAVVAGLMPGAAIGVVAPASEQLPETPTKWRRAGLKPVCTVASPYTPGCGGWQHAVEELRRAAEVRLVVLDCMGYDEAQRAWLARALELPVLTSGSVVTSVLDALL